MSVPQPLPGDLAVLDDLVARLGHVADEASLAAARLQRLNAGDWIGKTATAFGNAASTMPPKLTNASSAFLAGADAYRSYRTVLADAQLRARSAMGMWADAQSLTSSWQGQLAALPANDPGRNAPDPGAALRTRSETLYDAAVTDVDVAGRAAASALRSAADAAPHAPSFWAKAWHELASFGDGVWDGTVGIVKFAWEMSPIRMMVDPQGWWHDQVNMGKALWWGVHHPVEFGKAVANWDEWARDPAHAFGELIPNLLLAAATGGTGAAATATREAAGALADTAAALAAKLASHTRELRLLAGDETGAASLDLLTAGLAKRFGGDLKSVNKLVSRVEQANGWEFERLPGQRFRSPAGLIYGQGSSHGHRLFHVLAHVLPDDSKSLHTIFTDGLKSLSGSSYLRWGLVSPPPISSMRRR